MRKADLTNTFLEGVLMDLNPLIMPDNTMTSALNATLMTMNGNENVLLNDMGNGRVETAYLPEGYIPLGSTSFGGIIYVVSYNPLTNKSLIGSFPSPERNISSSEVSTMGATNISSDDFGWMGVEEGATKYYIKKIINLDLIFYPGDKFIVYSDNVASNYEKFYKEDDYTDLVKSIQTSRLDYLSLLALKQQNGEEISNKYDINKAIWELANKGITVSDNFNTYKVDIENKFNERVNIRNNLESLKSELLANRDSFTVNNSKYNSYVNLIDSLTLSIENYTAEKDHYSSLFEKVSSKIPILLADFDRIGAACDIAEGNYTIAQDDFLSALKRYSDLSDLITKSENAVIELKNLLSKIESAYAEAVSLESNLTALKSLYTNAADTAKNSYTELNKLIETNLSSIEDALKLINDINADSEALSLTLNKHLGDLKNILDLFDTSLVNINTYLKDNETLKSQLDAYEGYNYLMDRNESISSALGKWEALVVPTTYTAPAISGGIAARPPIFDLILPGRVDFEITDITDSVLADKYEAERDANIALATELKKQFPEDFNVEMAVQSLASNNKLITLALNNNFLYEALISNLKNKVESVQTSIDLNTSKLLSFESKISSLLKDNGELELQVSNLQSNETYYRNLADGLESLIASASTRVDELKSDRLDISSIIAANLVSINEYRDEIEAIDLDDLETKFNTLSHNYKDLLALKYDADDKLVTATNNKNLFSAQVQEFDNKITLAEADKEIYDAEKVNIEDILSKIDTDYESLIDEKIPKVEDLLSTVNDSIKDLINEATTTFDTSLLQTVLKQTIKIDLGCLTKDGKITKFNNLKLYHIPGVTITDSNNVDIEYRKQSDGSYKLQVKLSENNYADIISNLEEGKPKYIEDYDGLIYKDSDGEYKKVEITNADKQYTYHIFQYSGADDLPGDIDEYRNLVELPYNIFTSKLAGNIVVIGELIQATDFDASIENTITENKLYRPKFYLDLSNDTPFIPKGFKFEVTLTGNDGTNESTTFNMDFFASEASGEAIIEKVEEEGEVVEKVIGYKIIYPIDLEIYEVTTDCKTYNFEIDIEDIGEVEIEIPNGESTSKIPYNPLKSIFDKLENYFNEGNTRNKEYIIEFKITPYMNWGYLPLESTISVELDKIGTNDISIKRWQYYVDDLVTLNWGIESYMSEGSSIENIEFIFRWPYDTSTIYGVKYSIPVKESYFGTYVETLPLDTESLVYVTYTDPGVTVLEFLHSNILALVEIRVNCNINGELVTKKFYKWLYTTTVFNDDYLNKTEEDFCELQINPIINIEINSDEGVLTPSEFSSNLKQTIMGLYFYSEVSSVSDYSLKSLTKYRTKYLVNLTITSSAVLQNSYDIFTLKDTFVYLNYPTNNYGRINLDLTTYLVVPDNLSTSIIPGNLVLCVDNTIFSIDDFLNLVWVDNNENIPMSNDISCYYLSPIAVKTSHDNNSCSITIRFPFAYEVKGYCNEKLVTNINTFLGTYTPIITNSAELLKYYFNCVDTNNFIPTFVGTFGYSSGYPEADELTWFTPYGNSDYIKVYIGYATKITLTGGIIVDVSKNVLTLPYKSANSKKKYLLYLTGHPDILNWVNQYWINNSINNSSLIPILYKYGMDDSGNSKHGKFSNIKTGNATVVPADRNDSANYRLLTIGLLGEMHNNGSTTLHNASFIFLDCGYVGIHTSNGINRDTYTVSAGILDFYRKYLSTLANIYVYSSSGSVLEGSGVGIKDKFYYDSCIYSLKFTVTSKIDSQNNILKITLKSGEIVDLENYIDLFSTNMYLEIQLNNLIANYSSSSPVSKTINFTHSNTFTDWFDSNMVDSVLSGITYKPIGSSQLEKAIATESVRDPSKLYCIINLGQDKVVQEINNSNFKPKLLTFENNNNNLIISKTDIILECTMDLNKYLKYDTDKNVIKSRTNIITSSSLEGSLCYIWGSANLKNELWINGWNSDAKLLTEYRYASTVSVNSNNRTPLYQ